MFGRRKDDYYLTHMTDQELQTAVNNAKSKPRKRLMESLNDAMESSLDDTAARVRLQYHPRWKKICGVERSEDIDYNNPVVSTEYILCDPRIIRLLKQGRRDEVLKQFSEIQQ